LAVQRNKARSKAVADEDTPLHLLQDRFFQQNGAIHRNDPIGRYTVPIQRNRKVR